jgi:hypothetical protein
MASRSTSRIRRTVAAFLVLTFLAPQLVLSVFWCVRVAQVFVQTFLGDPTQWGEASPSTSVQGTVSATPGPKCPSRLAGNLVVVSCPAAPRVAYLLGLRVAAPTTFEQVLGNVVQSQATSATPSGAPATAPTATTLTCAVFEPTGALTEPLALCDVGGVDVGLAALRSGQVVLSQDGTVSRALLRGRTLEDSYVQAETAARLERRGVWWDYPSRGGGDPIAWRLRQDAQAANTGTLAVGIQAWIAQVLVVVGTGVAFLFKRGRESDVERDRRTRLVDALRLTIQQIETATSVSNWKDADALALTVTQLLAAERLSPDVRTRWDDVVHQLQGHPEVNTLKQYTARFEEVLRNDLALGPIA